MGEVKKLPERGKTCCYCGMKAEHPEFTCPRIAGVEMNGDATTVQFVAPEEWAQYLATLSGD